MRQASAKSSRNPGDVASSSSNMHAAMWSLRLRSSMHGWSASKPLGGRFSELPVNSKASRKAGGLGRALPPLGIRCDAVADPAQCRGVGPPQPDSGKHLVGRQVEVEAGSVGRLAHLVAELSGGLRLVWALVLGEPHVAVDAEHGAAVGARVGHEVLADRLQLGTEVGDELEQGLLHVLLVPTLVVLEPCTVVVGSQLEQELEEVGSEVRLHVHEPIDVGRARGLAIWTAPVGPAWPLSEAARLPRATLGE